MSKDFPWGEVVERHIIGTYVITEFIVGPEWEGSGETQFQYAGIHYDTLEEAMLDLVCHVYQPSDSNLFDYMRRLLGEKE